MQFIDQKQKAALPLEISSLDIEKANIASSTSVAEAVKPATGNHNHI